MLSRTPNWKTNSWEKTFLNNKPSRWLAYLLTINYIINNYLSTILLLFTNLH